ncbi:MAG: hypothetical protein CL693_09765 [Cellvibrionaceae bacterium]|nr:hypothetical protein [Cellvibrionaceae bacterium]|tara:strand:+ start:8780 stop:9076 length:297 start_codon:yes stop_codon:yes gene_type:complete
MKRLLFICNGKDTTGQAQEECLDAALTCAAMSFDTEVNFSASALETNANSIEQKMEMAEQFGITISIHGNSENEKLGGEIEQKESSKRIHQYDHVIQF